jgi:hypothetical protein
MSILSEAQEIVNGAFNFPDEIKSAIDNYEENELPKAVVLIYSQHYANPAWYIATVWNKELMDYITNKTRDRINYEKQGGDNPIRSFSNVLPLKE